jgi:hypothetical protein
VSGRGVSVEPGLDTRFVGRFLEGYHRVRRLRALDLLDYAHTVMGFETWDWLRRIWACETGSDRRVSNKVCPGGIGCSLECSSMMY